MTIQLSIEEEKKKDLKQIEQQIQTAVVKYIRLSYPDLLFCASAGGMRTSFKQAVKMKATGYVRGFPDLFIYEPVGKYYGLALEIKTSKGRPTKEQLNWKKRLLDRGYFAEIVYGFEHTRKVIDSYFSQDLD